MAVDSLALARRFEPVLYFHPQERFFPCDAKRYLELCALWKALAPFDKKASWGQPGASGARVPNISAGKIAGFASEAPPQGDTFLGQEQGGKFPFLEAESFLEVGGWKDSPGVTASSQNRHANLDFIQQLCDSNDANIGKLNDHRFWYYAEVYETVRLRGLLGALWPAILQVVFPTLQEPLLLCYYLFFPGHDEGLQGCENTDTGPQFGSFAGEWACIAILLEKKAGQTDHSPTWVGLTNRNVGVISFLGVEIRIGMKVLDWNTISKAPPAGSEHPLIFVANRTHGLHHQPGPQPLAPFSPNDPSAGSCGRVEVPGQALEDVAQSGSAESFPTENDVMLAKLFAPLTRYATFTFPAPNILQLGYAFAAGIWWVGLEHNYGLQPPGPGPPEATTPQFDFPPNAGQSGMVVHPQGMDPPDAPADPAKKVPWSSSDLTSTEPERKIGNRRYPFIVDRTSTDPDIRQIWWPSDDRQSGYLGRWGPRVTKDPKRRRAGMPFPEFWKMFFEALHRALNAQAEAWL